MTQYMSNIRKISDCPPPADAPLVMGAAPPIQPTLNALSLTPDSRVVALGREAGRFTLPLARLFAAKNGNGSVFVYDNTNEAAGRIVQKAKDAHLDAFVDAHRLLSVKPYAIPVANDEIDAVLAINTIQHHPSPELYFWECHRVLRPGGSLLVAERSDANSVSTNSSDLIEHTKEEIWFAMKRGGAEICTDLDIPGYDWAIQVVKPLIQLPS